jgi:hypothetical protein
VGSCLGRAHIYTQTYIMLIFTSECSLYVIHACILCRTIRILTYSVSRRVDSSKMWKLFVLENTLLQRGLEPYTGVFYYWSSSFHVNPLSLLLAHRTLRYALATFCIPHPTPPHPTLPYPHLRLLNNTKAVCSEVCSL